MLRVNFSLRYVGVFFTLFCLMKHPSAVSAGQCWIDSSISGVEGGIKLGGGRNLSLNVPVNSINVGQSLGDAKESIYFPLIIDCDKDINDKTRYFEGKVTGYTRNSISADFDGVPAAVFDTGVEGIGFSVSIKTPDKGWSFWNENPVRFWEDKYMHAMSLEGRYIYVLTKPLKSGLYNIPELNIGTADLYADGVGKMIAASILIPAGQIRVNAQTCTLSGQEKDNVDFGILSYEDIKNGKSDRSVMRAVTCPADDKISVHFTLSDKVFTDNRGDYIKNKVGNGFAKGVGVEMLFNDRAVKLGPISSESGVENQQYLGVGSQSLTLKARPIIIPGEKVTEGKLDATAVLTMSYQ
ncbi:fimbrial protein [Aeromonas salmonicida]|uniref:fimbrial protein n=1 Tax=Aeromonas salmonicida TaxID=645 RepID=UPI003D198A40